MLFLLDLLFGSSKEQKRKEKEKKEKKRREDEKIDWFLDDCDFFEGN